MSRQVLRMQATRDRATMSNQDEAAKRVQRLVPAWVRDDSGSNRSPNVEPPPQEECAERQSLFAGGLGVSPSFLILPPSVGAKGLIDSHAVTVQQDAAGVRGVPESSYSSPKSGGQGVEHHKTDEAQSTYSLEV